MGPAQVLHARSAVNASIHLFAGKYFQIAAFVMLLYDHLLTLEDEVERIWKQRVSGATILFIINRYGTLLSFIVVLDAFHDPRWSMDVFVKFEGAQTIFLVGICELVLILRVYALYGRSTLILLFLMTLWCAQIIVSSIGVHTGWAVPFPPSGPTCVLDSDRIIFAALWVSPLITESFIFVLTLWRIQHYRRRLRSTPVVQIFLRDGMMYFFVIFSANFMNFVVYVTVTAPDLKAVGASFSQLITSVMVSRLILNLRAVSSLMDKYRTSDESPRVHTTKSPSVEESLMDYAVGNLGEELRDSEPSSNGEENCGCVSNRLFNFGRG